MNVRTRAVGRDRAHATPARARQLKLRLSEAEFAATAAAARAAGLTPSGYAAEATLAAAIRVNPPVGEPLRVALAELIDTRRQVRSLTAILSQTSAALPGADQASQTLQLVVEASAGAVARLDAAAAAVTRGLR